MVQGIFKVDQATWWDAALDVLLARFGLTGIFVAITSEDAYLVIREGSRWRFGRLVGDWFADAVLNDALIEYDPDPVWA